MSRFLPDTSCMIAAVCVWHEQHASAAEKIERRLRRAEAMLVAAPALIEAYAVLTRLPAPHRLAAADALQLLEGSFTSSGRIVALTSKSYLALLRRAPQEGIAGGRTYDAVIAACVRGTKGTTILTFNASHFAGFARRGLKIVVPGGK